MKRIAKNTICLKPGEYIAPGEEVNPTKEEEKTLDAAGALQDKNARKVPASGPTKPVGEKLTAAISAAIGSIDTDIEDAWTSSGKPSVMAIEKILGYEVTPGERDTAWNQIQAAAKGNNNLNV